MSATVTITINPALDTTATAPRVTPDRKIRCRDATQHPGGGGINVARAIHELGGDAVALWTQGGWFGAAAARLLDDEAIDHVPIEIAGTTRQSFAVIETDTEHHFRFSTPGPRLTDDEIRQILATVQAHPTDHLVISGGLPRATDPDLYRRLVCAGRDQGARVLVDTHDEPLRAALEAGGVFLVKPNYRELATASGHDERDPEFDVTEAARSIVSDGRAEAVVVSLGKSGALLVTADTTREIAAPTVPINSRIGAGDSMLAGIVHRLAATGDLVESVRFGIAAGTAAVMTPGTELCRRDDVERLFRDMGRKGAERIA
jgi:6-phosphofructokinase 2